MGGVQIKEIKCANYYDAESVDKDFLYYLNEGLIPISEEMGTWTWFWWFHWMYSMFAQDYLEAMEHIILCAISNNVEGSRFGNTTYHTQVFKRHWDELYDGYFYYADMFWNPGM